MPHSSAKEGIWIRVHPQVRSLIKRVAADMEVNMIAAIETLFLREAKKRGVKLPDAYDGTQATH